MLGAVPTLPAPPGSSHAARRTAEPGQKDAGPWGLPVSSAPSVLRFRLGVGARAASSGGHPLPKGAGYPWPTDDQPHRARSLMHLHLNRTTGQTTHHRQATPSLHEPRGVERPRRDAQTGASGHRAPPRPALKTIQTIVKGSRTLTTQACACSTALSTTRLAQTHRANRKTRAKT